MLGQGEHSWLCGNKASLHPDSVFKLVSFLYLSALSVKVKCPLSICLSPWAVQGVPHRARPLPELTHVGYDHRCLQSSFVPQNPSQWVHGSVVEWANPLVCQVLSDLDWQMTGPFADCKWALPHCRPLLKCTGKAKVRADIASELWNLPFICALAAGHQQTFPQVVDVLHRGLMLKQVQKSP